MEVLCKSTDSKKMTSFASEKLNIRKCSFVVLLSLLNLFLCNGPSKEPGTEEIVPYDSDSHTFLIGF